MEGPVERSFRNDENSTAFLAICVLTVLMGLIATIYAVKTMPILTVVVLAGSGLLLGAVVPRVRAITGGRQPERHTGHQFAPRGVHPLDRVRELFRWSFPDDLHDHCQDGSSVVDSRFELVSPTEPAGIRGHGRGANHEHARLVPHRRASPLAESSRVQAQPIKPEAIPPPTQPAGASCQLGKRQTFTWKMPHARMR